MTHSKSGFTIVELLIVIVVIAILVAISVVAYNGIQIRSSSAAIQSNMRSYAGKIIEYYVNNGSYPRSAAELNGLNVTIASNVYKSGSDALRYCNLGDRFAIAGEGSSGLGFYYNNQTGGLKQRSTAPNGGWCSVNYEVPEPTGRFAAWTSSAGVWQTAQTHVVP